MNLSSTFRYLRYRLFYRLILHREYQLIELGSRANECSWNLHPDHLKSQSIVYGGGVGRDISFEHDLVQKFGCSVVLFDPSPTGTKTMALEENQIPQFKFHQAALADHCGTLKFSAPQWESEGSWYNQSDTADGIEVPCLDLSTLMKMNGHSRIDLLKIDIEGAEYQVVDDILKRKLPVKQILVEYHHGIIPGITRGKSIRSMLKLILAGYHCLDQTGNNHTFLHPRL